MVRIQAVTAGTHIPVEVVLAHMDPMEPAVLVGPAVEGVTLFARTSAAVPVAVLGVHSAVVDNRRPVATTEGNHSLEVRKLVADWGHGMSVDCLRANHSERLLILEVRS